MERRVSITDIKAMKKRGEKIVMLTAYDYPSARLVEEAGLPIILVGDSLGMVVLGYDSTIPVTMDEMLHHVKAVVRGSRRAHIVADMPFMSYQAGPQEALHNAGRMLKEGGAQSVKLEGGLRVAETVRLLVEAGIINVSSVAGRVAAPLNGLYAASKYALEALSESLHYEVGHFGVRVHLIEPGGVDTPFAGKRRLVGAAAGDGASPYAPMVVQWEQAEARMPGARSQAGAIAEVILEANEKGDKLRYPVGQDAQMVLNIRRQMDDEAFEAGMRQQLGLTW